MLKLSGRGSETPLSRKRGLRKFFLDKNDPAPKTRRLNEIIRVAAAAIAALAFCGVALAADAPGAKLPAKVESAAALKPVSASAEAGFDAFHVQGLDADADNFYFTSVNKKMFEAWIFKVDRKTMKLKGKRNVAKLLDFHPGGIDFDGERIWIPVAVYSERSHTYMMTVDPETLTRRIEFEVKDHIGAVARVGETVVGANWDAEKFYFWTTEGRLLEVRDSPTDIGYQDCKGEAGFLVCSGGGRVDWIDVGAWRVAKSLDVPGTTPDESRFTREGMTLVDGMVYFIPDDGPRARIYGFDFSDGRE